MPNICCLVHSADSQVDSRLLCTMLEELLAHKFIINFRMYHYATELKSTV